MIAKSPRDERRKSQLRSAQKRYREREKERKLAEDALHHPLRLLQSEKEYSQKELSLESQLNFDVSSLAIIDWLQSLGEAEWFEGSSPQIMSVWDSHAANFGEGLPLAAISALSNQALNYTFDDSINEHMTNQVETLPGTLTFPSSSLQYSLSPNFSLSTDSSALIEHSKILSPSDGLWLPKMTFVQAAKSIAKTLGQSCETLHQYNISTAVRQGWYMYCKERGLSVSKVDPMKALERSKEQYKIVKQATDAPAITYLLDEKMKKSVQRIYTGSQSKVKNKWTWDGAAENMKPTDIQLCIKHLPYVDVIFPWKSMRDKIILFSGILFEMDNVCASATYEDPQTGHQNFTIWGNNPTNEMSWELSELFIRDWWFLIDKAILQQTNWWRMQRGESAIVDDRIL